MIQIFNNPNRRPLREAVRRMKPKAVIIVPFGQYSGRTVRNYASEIGLELQRAYSVNLDREARAYKITRTK